MAASDIVVVGASAGGVEALRALVRTLPSDLPAAVLVVLHIPRRSCSALPLILRRSGSLPAEHAVDGEPLQDGRIYVAPPDRHLLIRDGHVELFPGPAENGHRPAVDPLFRSAALANAERVIAVVLSGARDDGTAGLAAVRERGGVTVVQDPADALHPSMPQSALDRVAIDHVLPAAEIGALIAKLVAPRLAAGDAAQPPHPKLHHEIAVAEMSIDGEPDYVSKPAGFGCPTCHGALFEVDTTPLPRYRCRVGHAWSPETLLDEQAAAYEGALWMALRSLEEKSALSQRMADSARRRSSDAVARRFDTSAKDAQAAAELIRGLIRRTDVDENPTQGTAS